MLTCEICGKDHPENLRFCPETGKLFAPRRFFPEGMILEDKYCLGRLLGVGGISVVFQAKHTMLGKDVAVKLLSPGLSDDPEMIERILREAKVASSTGHRNIVSITDMGETPEGLIFFVMELLRGRTLEYLIQGEAPIPAMRATWLIREVLTGLHVVHGKGIIHRNLKPGNVMVAIDEDGQELVKLMDFGISKVGETEGVQDPVATGRILGLSRYMSPEQARGQGDLDPRADIYACGAMLYHMLSGEPAANASTHNARMAQILDGTILPLSSINPDIPDRMEKIVMRAMALDRRSRFPDAGAFRRALMESRNDPLNSTDVGVGQQSMRSTDPGLGTAGTRARKTTEEDSPADPAGALTAGGEASDEAHNAESFAQDGKDIPLNQETSGALPPEGGRVWVGGLVKDNARRRRATRRSRNQTGSGYAGLGEDISQSALVPLDHDQTETEREEDESPPEGVEQPAAPEDVEELLEDGLEGLEFEDLGLKGGESASSRRPTVEEMVEPDDPRPRAADEFGPGKEPSELELDANAFQVTRNEDPSLHQPGDGAASTIQIQRNLGPAPDSPAEAVEGVARSPHATTGTLYKAQTRNALMRFQLFQLFYRVIFLGGLAFFGILAYHNRQEIRRFFHQLFAEEKVNLRVETSPQQTEIYVDGVLQISRPIVLPRSEIRTFDIRVAAQGYFPKYLELKSDRSQSIRVVLIPK